MTHPKDPHHHQNQNQNPRRDPRQPPYHGPTITKLSSVQPTKVRWLWQDRLALGKLTLLAGDPGLGKSYLTLDLAARVSAGLPFPGETSAGGGKYGKLPRKVILLSAEDDPADTIRPRLDAAGADCDNIVLIDGIAFGENRRPVNLREDIKHVERAVQLMHRECRLIIIDPISAYLGDDEGHSNTKVRNMLAPLARLAQDYGVAVLAVTHLNKGGGQGPTNAIYRTMGSLAFTAAARTVHLVARDPSDAAGQRRLMLPIKNNLGHDRTGWGFALTNHDFIDPTGGDPDDYPNARRRETKISWDPDPTQDTADALLLKLNRTPGGSGGQRETPAMDEAIEFLRQSLQSGPQPMKSIQAAAEAAGISRVTLKRAKAELGVESRREGYGSDGQYVWTLIQSDAKTTAGLFPNRSDTSSGSMEDHSDA